MKKILAAFDGSVPALDALQMGADLSRAVGARLVICYVVPTYSLPPDLYESGGAQLEDRHRKFGEKLLAEVGDRFRGKGHDVETRLLSGSAPDALAELTHDDDVWMVVVGSSSDRSAASRLLLGSVADRLTHLSKKPVLVVR